MEGKSDGEGANLSAGPGAPIPPPLLLVFLFAVGIVIQYVAHATLLPSPWNLLGVPVFFLGVVLAGFALRTLARSNVPGDPRKAPPSLVTGGPYAFTRNPVYLGFAVSYLGGAIWANSAVQLALLVLAVVYLDAVQVRREEKYLEERFGEEYRTYKQRVRRWF